MQRSRTWWKRVPSRALLALLCTSAIVLISAQPSALASRRSASPPSVRRIATDLATPSAQLWAKRYNGPSGDDAAHDLAVSSDGSTVFVTGYSRGSTSGADYATVAYATFTGARLWSRRFNGSENTGDVGRALRVSPDSSTVYVTGRSHGLTTGDDYATVAYDVPTGKQLWASSYTGPKAGDDEATSLGVSPDGATVFVTGHSHGASSGADYATVAYDASTGTQLWVSRYNGPANADDAGLALGVSPDGSSVYVTGRSPSSEGGIDYATVGYDATSGAQRWATRYNGPANGDDVALSLGVSADGGSVFVTGDSAGLGRGADYATAAYDSSTGAERWVSRYNGPANTGDVAQSLGSSPDSSTVFVTGDSQGSGSADDYATVAYEASNGAQVWARRYNGPANHDDVARAISLSPDGATAFVTGHSRGSASGEDYATVAYRSSTGARLWVSRYNGLANGNDSATGLGVSPDGSTVFAAGRSMGATTGNDYATVAISAA
jgi:hypothetical protein